jgi:hypothetical protein
MGSMVQGLTQIRRQQDFLIDKDEARIDDYDQLANSFICDYLLAKLDLSSCYSGQPVLWIFPDDNATFTRLLYD